MNDQCKKAMIFSILIYLMALVFGTVFIDRSPKWDKNAVEKANRKKLEKEIHERNKEFHKNMAFIICMTKVPAEKPNWSPTEVLNWCNKFVKDRYE